MKFGRRIFSARPFTRSVLLLGSIAVLLIAIAACGGGDDNGATATPAGSKTPATTPTPADTFDYGSLGGEIRIDGSSTVFPITEAVAEEFGKVAGTRVNAAFSGTGGGFEKFCRGEIQISDASRPIKQNEKDACAANGITDLVEIRVATDALTVVVNPGNDFVDCLTVAQLGHIFTSGGASTWDQVDTSFPAQSIVRYFPGTDSGTFDYFKQTIVQATDANATHTGDGTPSEDDNVLATGVEGDKYSIGYFGIAYYLEAGSRLKDVAVDGGNGCVKPSAETALDGTYKPLSRPLFIYTREKFLTEKPEVLGFVNFYLVNAVFLTKDVGYVPIPDNVLQQQFAKIKPFLP